MPYIKKDKREGLLESTVHELMELTDPGDINFVISSLTWKIFEKNKSYATANMLVGVLECVKQELYRRPVSRYEDIKIGQNGDLDV